ncbi:uncharacterized protein LOC143586076 [Bidens hawaiensis]|uniref:uncharacterized protein LOC143586076 n=1 Tax=Bidens hawaiensis TaxID=980011 RepID=UPI00404AF343
MYRAELDLFGKENLSFEEGESPKGRKSVIITRYSSLRGVYGEEIFFTEIEMLTAVKHENIVSLLGYCFEAFEMILITEDLSYGYLVDYLENVNRRGFWEIRLKISSAVACTLNYLHHEIEDQKVIINHQISSLNIGLDEDHGAMIFDFGRSIFLPPNQKDEALYVDGIGGKEAYIDPEYKKTSRLKRESDVYSFGVLLFEILFGVTASDPRYDTGTDGYMAHVARQSYRTGTLEEKIDPILKEETGENNFILNRGPNKDSLRTYIGIAYKCVAESQDKRPTMKEVVEELEKASSFQANKGKLGISLEVIELATKNFNHRIGGGGFGNVFPSWRRWKTSKVIHRDIKTANILLNNDWKAKLADFGLSLISPITKETKYVIDYVCGTKGYLDPLYYKSQFLTIESDIYSFGVVLFEILCGKSTYDVYKNECRYLQDFVKENFAKGKLNEMVFEKIRKPIEQKSLTIFQNIAYQCLHDEREERPTTKKVLAKLENALEIQNMISTMTKFTPLQITLKEVVEGTNNFHVDNIIGHVKFGTTYKGRLLRSRKEIKIATRRFDCKHGEVDLKFLREISVLYDLKHTNLVSIVGFCDEQEKKIIVTMYEANKSLTQYLNSLNLTWTQRLRICVGIACALSYLHYDKVRDYAIIHCNINSDTILLDENWEAKLSSFEVSIKQSKNNKDRARHCEHIGTMGCMDPTIEKTGDVSHKSDIYSFGIILFEMLCGRKAFIQDEDNSFLAPLAKYHYEKETLQEIIHPCLQWNQMSAQSLLKYSNMAYFCLKEDRADRPDMDFIVRESEKALEIQLRRENIVNIGKVKEPNKMDTLQTFGMGNETDIRIWNWV